VTAETNVFLVLAETLSVIKQM